VEVCIRLQKAGKSASKRYNYRIVAISRGAARQTKNLDILGYYDPSKKPAVFSLDQEKLKYWLQRGAQMSDTIKSLASKKG
jgi:small subunit ribosomal protein S16